MLELLFLLLPVAAGYGWIMGRNSAKQKEFKSKASLSKQYSAGLNFLLSDQEEKAVEHLIEFLEVNADTLETHLALANLFRKRGEFDKALEIHEHLDKLSLDTACSNKIKLELTRDYISAGMLDRAESTLLAMKLDEQNRDIVIQMLVSIYQTMKDWRKAVDYCARQKSLTPRLKTVVSHHCCELAEESMETDSVIKWYKKALKYDDSCARAHLALAGLAYKQGKFDKAIDIFSKVLSADSGYKPLILDRLESCYLDKGDQDGFYRFLKQQNDTGVGFAIKYSQYIEQYEGPEKALGFILKNLERTPSIRAFVQLLDLESKNTDSPQAAAQFKQVKELVSRYLAGKPLYECRQCGFATRQHYWLCPSCQSWGNVRATTGLDGF